MQAASQVYKSCKAFKTFSPHTFWEKLQYYEQMVIQVCIPRQTGNYFPELDNDTCERNTNNLGAF